MNKLVKKKIIYSTKGPFGGLSVNDGTKKTTLLDLLKTVDPFHPFDSCVLKMKKCNDAKPCVLHDQVSHLRNEIHEMLIATTIGDMVEGNKPELLQRITVY
jgi:DNA-binding IscR family transcriptional regulator